MNLAKYHGHFDNKLEHSNIHIAPAAPLALVKTDILLVKMASSSEHSKTVD